MLLDVCGNKGEQFCCETLVDAEENSAVRLLWIQRRTVLL